jgi:hypothetical protein
MRKRKRDGNFSIGVNFVFVLTLERKRRVADTGPGNCSFSMDCEKVLFCKRTCAWCVICTLSNKMSRDDEEGLGNESL